jgi:hypothetical protein
MDKSDLSTDSGITVVLTVEGRLALAVDALAAAQKTRRKERRKCLCEQAVMYLRPVIQD